MREALVTGRALHGAAREFWECHVRAWEGRRMRAGDWTPIGQRDRQQDRGTDRGSRTGTGRGSRTGTGRGSRT